jgi:ubiquitin carboxyl-terminal hydrolase 4/11/15
MALVDRFTKRIRARNALLRIAESDSTKDPFGLLPLMHLVIPSQGLVSLQSEDTDVCLSALSSHEGLTITLEWKAMDTKSPLFQTLFESLYGEEGSAPLPPPKANSLYNCFSLFTEQEKLAPTEMWYCSNCKDHKEAFKEMQFWDFPDLLVIQLKRFSQSQNSYSFDKDDSEVDFPLEALDLRDRVQHESDGSEVYDLVAVSHHFGGLGMGHYIAHARNERDGMWYELDDSSVRPLGNNQSAAEKVKQGSAYVLFYVKQKLVPASWNNAGSLSSLASSAAL